VIPVDQTQFAITTDERAGNCMQAVLASLLELPLDDVPNFAAIESDEPGKWFLALDDWLHDRGLGIVVIYFGGPDAPEGKLPSAYFPNGLLCVLAGRSKGGPWGHVVVGKIDEEGRAEIVHDPNPARTGLDLTWEVWLIVPLDPASRT
jgi:hypothetical protein